MNALSAQNLGRRRPPHKLSREQASALAAMHALHHCTTISAGQLQHLTCNHIHTTTMAAIYKPCEAIALLRPCFILPRIQPSSSRRTSPLCRNAFSTTRNAQASHSSTPNTPPGPQRKSITLTGDTGQVRWSDLSPGEKAVRTTQQSVNLVVVLVGVLATVSSNTQKHNRNADTNSYAGWRRLLPLLRRLLPLLQNRPLQPRRHHDPRRSSLSSPPRSLQ